MPSPFNVKGEVFSRNALTFKVKPEGISENPFMIHVNVILHKYLRTNIVFNLASENQPGIEMRGRERRSLREPGRGRMKKGQLGSYGTPLVILRHASTERDR
ncbi:hypothetical protein C0033_20130 [Clostridium sp. chh4-2]|nr:hypothetical protein C0033_20130 [Clostridium sp. chh4-2]